MRPRPRSVLWIAAIAVVLWVAGPALRGQLGHAALNPALSPVEEPPHLFFAVLGATILWGLWWELGCRLSEQFGIARVFALPLGQAAATSLWMALCLGGLGDIAVWVQGAIGLALAGHGITRRAADPPPDLHSPLPWFALAIAASTWWFVAPSYLHMQDGSVEITGFYLSDGLWFSGSSVSIRQGWPVPDARFAGAQLAYHLQSLAAVDSTAAALALPHASTLYYIVLPSWAAILATTTTWAVRSWQPSVHRGWSLVAGVAAVYLSDIASPLGWLLREPGSEGYFERAPPHMLLGNHHVVGTLINAPFAASIAWGMSGVVLWHTARRPATAHAAGFLLCTACLAKGSMAPVLLVGLGAAALLQLRRARGVPTGRAAARRSGVVGAWILVAQVILTGLLSASTLRLGFVPGYLAGYIQHTLGDLAPGSAVLTVALWIPLAVGYHAWAWHPRAIASPDDEHDGAPLQVMLGAALVTGIILANTVAFTTLGGMNELYFTAVPLSLLAPLTFAGLAACGPRMRAVAALPLLLAAVGAAHLFAAREVSTQPRQRTLVAADADVFTWLRRVAPEDSVVLYYRYTETDDARAMWPPINELYFVVSGWGQRQAVVEGSMYGNLWRRSDIQARRAQVAAFYSGKNVDEGLRFLHAHSVDFVLAEPWNDLSIYGGALRLVARGDGLHLYAVDPRLQAR